jgi:dTDP-glucose pyrophosphorylase
LPRSPFTDRYDPIFQYTRLQPFTDQADDAFVADPMLNETDKPILVYRIEKRSDVGVENVNRVQFRNRSLAGPEAP